MNKVRKYSPFSKGSTRRGGIFLFVVSYSLFFILYSTLIQCTFPLRREVRLADFLF